MKKRTILPVIECFGSEYEIGRQYGEQAADHIRESVSLMCSTMIAMPYMAEKNAVLAASKAYLNNVRSFDPEALDRVKGMAEGSGMSFDEIFALQCYSELFVNYPRLAALCTSFGVTGSATSDGRTIIGQNVDWHPDATIDLVRITRKDGLRMLVLFLCGYAAYYLTSEGIGNCANLTLCPPAAVTNHVPFAFYHYVAMRQKTAREAMEVLKNISRGVGYIHIAGADGTMQGIESNYHECQLMEPVKGVLVHGNHYETDRFKKHDLAYTYIQDSFHRSGRMRELIASAHGTLTPEKMMVILTDHRGHPKSVCTHVDPKVPAVFASLSVASFVMLPAEGKMYIAAGPPCENEFVEYQV
ncbi:MAG: C45 family autoproteolytic acyltransferase/hydrolase [Nitrospiraceae bacterium]|nr:C45 family autoproteolytic acyltransferase/hydrolase [Nitrospiraceae bacterium]